MIIYDGYDVDSPSFGNSAQVFLVVSRHPYNMSPGSHPAAPGEGLAANQVVQQLHTRICQVPKVRFFWMVSTFWFIGPYQYWEGLNLLNGYWWVY